MPHPDEPQTSKLGRFDQSFFVRTLISFFIFTLVIAGIELGIRFGLVLYDFHVSDNASAQVAAKQLAADVQSIMLNQGGPVASRTVYPIIKRNMRLAGYEIALIPSHVTATSIPKLYQFEPEGIPEDWPDGIHNEGSVELKAEQFCIRCHVDAEPGDVLGTVYVRDYLDTRLERWWNEVRLTGAISLVNIVLHSVILFFLLRMLMAPLLSLKAAVSELAKGGRGLSSRAEVKSSNEFGELAHDLNLFLDRADQILSDLRGTIEKMVGVNARLAGVTGRAKTHIARVEEALSSTIPSLGDDTTGSANLVENDLLALEVIVRRLAEQEPVKHPGQVGDLLESLEAVQSDWRTYQGRMAGMPRLIHEVHELRHMMTEVAYLEEQLREVADAGRRILDRLMA